MNAKMIAQIQQSHENPVTRIDSQSRLHHSNIMPARLFANEASTLRPVSWTNIPASFTKLFLLTGTIFLIYTLGLHQAIQSALVITVLVLFASIIILYLLTCMAMYSREQRAQRGASIESHKNKRLLELKKGSSSGNRLPRKSLRPL